MKVEITKERPVARLRNEKQVARRLQMIAAVIPGLRLWRNNIGKVRTKKGALYHFGLPPGSSDFIGIYKGRFVAVETKFGKNPVTDKQRRFLNTIKRMGGIAMIVNEHTVGLFHADLRARSQ